MSRNLSHSVPLLSEVATMNFLYFLTLLIEKVGIGWRRHVLWVTVQPNVA